MDHPKEKILVLGMGNPILRDDAVGLCVIDDLRGRFSDPMVSLEKTSLSGRGLLDLLAGYSRAIIVDAIQTGGLPGEIHRLTPGDFIDRHAAPYDHNADFIQILSLGRRSLCPMPEEIVIIAIEAKDICDFGEGLTPEVERAIPEAAECVLAEIFRSKPNHHPNRSQAGSVAIRPESADSGCDPVYSGREHPIPPIPCPTRHSS